MKLLFQTEGTAGSTELKELMGFIDLDLKFKNVLPDIVTATREVIKLIGKEVYDKAVELYNNGNVSDENKMFIYSVRYPIAVNAYRLFSPSNDIAHTNNGRKMRQDENEKSPFEWMIDRDNTALEKRYYRALDDLITFLDDSKTESETENTIYTIWKNSDAFKKTHNLFIRTVDEFDQFFPIESRLLLIKLAPGISECEQYEIRSRVSNEKINALKQALKEGTPITDVNDLALIRLIRQASAAYSLAWAMPRLSVQLYPEGVLQFAVSDRATTRGAKPSLKMETEAAREAFMESANKAFAEIEKLLEPAPTPCVDEPTEIMPKQMFGDTYFSA